jgi:hypothetical protein
MPVWKKWTRIQNYIYQTVRGKDKISMMHDVDNTTIADWEVLVWNATTSKREWKKIEDIWALDYKWAWDASTNSPALASSVGNKWDYYVVSVKWTTTLDGMSDREVWDMVLFNWTIRQRIAWWAAYVDLTDAQTVWWVKTFTSSPVVPSPANPTDASNKNYVDWQAVAMAISLW